MNFKLLVLLLLLIYYITTTTASISTFQCLKASKIPLSSNLVNVELSNDTITNITQVQITYQVKWVIQICNECCELLKISNLSIIDDVWLPPIIPPILSINQTSASIQPLDNFTQQVTTTSSVLVPPAPYELLDQEQNNNLPKCGKNKTNCLKYFCQPLKKKDSCVNYLLTLQFIVISDSTPSNSFVAINNKIKVRGFINNEEYMIQICASDHSTQNLQPLSSFPRNYELLKIPGNSQPILCPDPLFSNSMNSKDYFIAVNFTSGTFQVDTVNNNITVLDILQEYFNLGATITILETDPRFVCQLIFTDPVSIMCNSTVNQTFFQGQVIPVVRYRVTFDQCNCESFAPNQRVVQIVNEAVSVIFLMAREAVNFDQLVCPCNATTPTTMPTTTITPTTTMIPTITPTPTPPPLINCSSTTFFPIFYNRSESSALDVSIVSFSFINTSKPITCTLVTQPNNLVYVIENDPQTNSMIFTTCPDNQILNPPTRCILDSFFGDQSLTVSCVGDPENIIDGQITLNNTADRQFTFRNNNTIDDCPRQCATTSELYNKKIKQISIAALNSVNSSLFCNIRNQTTDLATFHANIITNTADFTLCLGGIITSNSQTCLFNQPTRITQIVCVGDSRDIQNSQITILLDDLVLSLPKEDTLFVGCDDPNADPPVFDSICQTNTTLPMALPDIRLVIIQNFSLINLELTYSCAIFDSQDKTVALFETKTNPADLLFIFCAGEIVDPFDRTCRPFSDSIKRIRCSINEGSLGSGAQVTLLFSNMTSNPTFVTIPNENTTNNCPPPPEFDLTNCSISESFAIPQLTRIELTEIIFTPTNPAQIRVYDDANNLIAMYSNTGNSIWQLVVCIGIPSQFACQIIGTPLFITQGIVKSQSTKQDLELGQWAKINLLTPTQQNNVALIVPANSQNITCTNSQINVNISTTVTARPTSLPKLSLPCDPQLILGFQVIYNLTNIGTAQITNQSGFQFCYNQLIHVATNLILVAIIEDKPNQFYCSCGKCNFTSTTPIQPNESKLFTIFYKYLSKGTIGSFNKVLFNSTVKTIIPQHIISNKTTIIDCE